MSGITLLELFDDAQGVKVMVEASAVRMHQLVQLALAGVAERRMANVMNERECFRQLGIQAEGSGDGTRNLRDLQSVRQAVAKVIGVTSGENLRFGFEAAKRARVNDAITVPRIFPPIRVRRLRKMAAA
jgi:hypothetical protein